MVNENLRIDLLNLAYIKENNVGCFVDCMIDTIDLIGVEMDVPLVLEGCIINDLKIHSCWFVNGLLLKNSIIKGFVDYQMGGHNKSTIILEGNVFHSFFDFFDCQFQAPISLRYNIFKMGTNLLGNKTEGFANTFEEGWFIEDNVGAIDLDK